MPSLGKILGPLAGGAGYSALLDRVSYDGDYSPGSFTDKRKTMALVNALIGAGGTKLMGTKGHGPTGVALMAAGPMKDVALAAQKPLHDFSGLVEKQQELAKEQIDAIKSDSSKRNALYAALGIGGLGLGAGALAHGVAKHKEQKANRGKIKITLPTEQEGDVETQVEMPWTQSGLSDQAMWQIGRDVKRKLRAEGAERTIRRKD